MDTPDGDPFADLDAEMNAVGETPPDVEMPLPDEMTLPATVPLVLAPVPVAPPQPFSLFNYGAAPAVPKVWLESLNGNLVSIPRTAKVNCSVDGSEFRDYAMDFDRHGTPAGLKYA